MGRGEEFEGGQLGHRVLTAWVGKGQVFHITREGSGTTVCGKGPTIEDKEDQWKGSTTCLRCQRLSR